MSHLEKCGRFGDCLSGSTRGRGEPRLAAGFREDQTKSLKSARSVWRLLANQWGQSSPGFTLLELLVVITVIAILAGLLLPVLSRARAEAVKILCLNHTKQLTLAWTAYADDNADRLVNNHGMDEVLRRRNSWVNNVLDWTLRPENTNAILVRNGLLGVYAGRVVEVYRCPADRYASPIQRRARWGGRSRSYSMNAFVGDIGEHFVGGGHRLSPEWTVMFKGCEIRSPASTFLLVDEHPDSVNEAHLFHSPSRYSFTDEPAAHHGRAACFSFTDGHAESHRWESASMAQPIRYIPYTEFHVGDAPADKAWLDERTSYPRE